MKLNENTKVTLTVGQLRKLVEEMDPRVPRAGEYATGYIPRKDLGLPAHCAIPPPCAPMPEAGDNATGYLPKLPNGTSPTLTSEDAFVIPPMCPGCRRGTPDDGHFHIYESESTVTLSDVEITPDKIQAAEQVLIDNGIDEDEADTVLQAIGYTLLNVELYPENDLVEEMDPRTPQAGGNATGYFPKLPGFSGGDGTGQIPELPNDNPNFHTDPLLRKKLIRT